ncbi:MAG: PilZ domain-containing protein [Thermodesulfobacteriota bacterium]
MDVFDFLSNLAEHLPVGVNIPTVSGRVLKYQGLVARIDSPVLSVTFADDRLPGPEEIDAATDCLVFVETGEIVTLICTISGVPDRSRLELTCRELIQHGQKRNFFRGPAGRLSITWQLQNSEDPSAVFAALGVNISCGGMMLVFDQPVKRKDRLVLDIHLPDPVNRSVTCKAVVLRVNQKDAGRFFVAAEFEALDAGICDDIMAFCFAEQRRMLREKVATKDEV